MMKMVNKKLSFVIPCYRSENTIMAVVDEIEKTVQIREGYDYEIILVNDGSPDDVWNVIQKRAENDFHIIGINLSKNFGQHCALMAGYNHCSGDYVISLDDDGQCPVNELYALVDKLEEGYDIVYASYRAIHQSWFRRLGSDFAKITSDYLFGLDRNSNKGSSFHIVRKFVLDEVIHYRHPYPYIAGLFLRITNRVGFVPVEQRDRMSGSSGYTLASLVSLWLNCFTSFSVKPLRIGTYCGIFLSLLGFLLAFVTVIRKLFISPDMVAGWSSIISAILLIGGMILFMLGLIGEYIGRIYICINESPQYIVKIFVKIKEFKKCEKLVYEVYLCRMGRTKFGMSDDRADNRKRRYITSNGGSAPKDRTLQL